MEIESFSFEHQETTECITEDFRVGIKNEVTNKGPIYI